MSISEKLVRNALKAVKYPGFTRDIVSFGLVKSVNIDNGEVKVQLALATNDPNVPAAIKNDAEQALRKIEGVRSAKVLIDIHAPPAGAGASMGATRIPGIKHVIAVASGKGGVGKSTVAANLAVALGETGARVGLCDCDIYGPSISLMFGTRERPTATEENKIIPIEQYGLRLMSMGFLLDDTSPAILRGPMVTRYTQQFLRQVEWGELDFLVLDLPPALAISNSLLSKRSRFPAPSSSPRRRRSHSSTRAKRRQCSRRLTCRFSVWLRTWPISSRRLTESNTTF